MRPEITQYVIRITRELADILGIALDEQLDQVGPLILLAGSTKAI